MNAGQYVEGDELCRQPNFSRQSGRLQAYLEGLTRAAGHADRVYVIAWLADSELCCRFGAGPARRPLVDMEAAYLPGAVEIGRTDDF